MCRVLRVHRSGFYAWLKSPLSNRARENKRLLGLIRESFLQSGNTYGSAALYTPSRKLSPFTRLFFVLAKLRFSPKESLLVAL